MKRFAGVIVRNEDDQILVLYNRHKNPHWRIPGGKVEDGETSCTAAIRELREETGIWVTADQLTYCGEHDIDVDSGTWTGYLYATRATPDMKPRITEPDKFDAIAWYRLDAIERMEPGSLTAAEIRKVYDVL